MVLAPLTESLEQASSKKVFQVEQWDIIIKMFIAYFEQVLK